MSAITTIVCTGGFAHFATWFDKTVITWVNNTAVPWIQNTAVPWIQHHVVLLSAIGGGGAAIAIIITITVWACKRERNNNELARKMLNHFHPNDIEADTDNETSFYPGKGDLDVIESDPEWTKEVRSSKITGIEQSYLQS